MCTYTFTLDDKLVNSISAAFKNKESMEQWLQQELELLVKHRAENIRQSKSQKRKNIEKKILELEDCKGTEGFFKLGGLLSDSSTYDDCTKL